MPNSLAWIERTAPSIAYAGLCTSSDAHDLARGLRDRFASLPSPLESDLPLAVERRFWLQLIELAVAREEDVFATGDWPSELVRPGQCDLPATAAWRSLRAYRDQVAAEFALSARELALRGGPLRETWQARGPGMLRWLENHRHVDFSAPGAIALLYPFRGGHGMVIGQGKAVGIEAVLYNPSPTLPETARLAWLLLRQANRRNRAAEDGWREQLLEVCIVLQAAEHVELAHCDAPTFGLACEQWMAGPKTEITSSEVVWQWWYERRNESVPFLELCREARRVLAASHGD